MSDVAPACPHCGRPIAGAVEQPVPHKPTVPAAALTADPVRDFTRSMVGCGGLCMVVIVAFAIRVYSLSSDTPSTAARSGALVGTTRTTKAGYIGCLTKPAMERAVELAKDVSAFGLFLADPANGCAELKPGVQVTVEESSWGLVRVRPVGQTMSLWALRELVQ